MAECEGNQEGCLESQWEHRLRTLITPNTPSSLGSSIICCRIGGQSLDACCSCSMARLFFPSLHPVCGPLDPELCRCDPVLVVHCELHDIGESPSLLPLACLRDQARLQIDDFWLDTVDIGHLLQVALGSLVVTGAETGFGFAEERNEILCVYRGRVRDSRGLQDSLSRSRQ